MRASPKDYTDEIADEICLRVSDGYSLNQVGKMDDMPSAAAIYSWMDKYPSFKEKYARAREIRSDKLGNEMIEIADSDDDPAKVRNRLDARKFVVSRMSPKSWGDRLGVDVEHSGSVALPIQMVVCLAGSPDAAQPCQPVIDVTPTNSIPITAIEKPCQLPEKTKKPRGRPKKVPPNVPPKNTGGQ